MEFLIIVDAQNDFITGKLAVPGAEETVKNICHELEQSSAFLIVTQDVHDPGEYALSVERNHLPEHCNRNSNGYLTDYGEVSPQDDLMERLLRARKG